MAQRRSSAHSVSLWQAAPTGPGARGAQSAIEAYPNARCPIAAHSPLRTHAAPAGSEWPSAHFGIAASKSGPRDKLRRRARAAPSEPPQGDAGMRRRAPASTAPPPPAPGRRADAARRQPRGALRSLGSRCRTPRTRSPPPSSTKTLAHPTISQASSTSRSATVTSSAAPFASRRAAKSDAVCVCARTTLCAMWVHRRARGGLFVLNSPLSRGVVRELGPFKVPSLPPCPLRSSSPSPHDSRGRAPLDLGAFFGARGTNVNKVSSKVELRFDFEHSRVLPDDPGPVSASSRRSARCARPASGGEPGNARTSAEPRRCAGQARGSGDRAAHRPKRRRPTRPSRGSVESRLSEKRHHSDKTRPPNVLRSRSSQLVDFGRVSPDQQSLSHMAGTCHLPAGSDASRAARPLLNSARRSLTLHPLPLACEEQGGLK